MNPINPLFWKGKKVFVTGHTGFKGSWLCMFLHQLEAEVHGYALEPPTQPSLYKLCNLDEWVHSTIADIRDLPTLQAALHKASPDIVIHMAAQPLVRQSYADPVETYTINIVGTINLLEAIRKTPSVKAVVNVTTDKCYENKEWHWGYREDEPLGGYDPYSSSKACSEIVTAAYRRSFFSDKEKPNVAIATARAGNVIGGGDWATDRLIPDFIRAILQHETVIIRNPQSIRPWQHVLEPLSGYLLLAEKLFREGNNFASSWNFGPEDQDARTVEWIVQYLCNLWGKDANYKISTAPQPHEATYLKLDCSKAKALLGWYPQWKLEKTLKSITDFYQAYAQQADLRQICLDQVKEYLKL